MDTPKITEAYQETEFPVLPLLSDPYSFVSRDKTVFAIDPGQTTGWAFLAPWDCEVGTITTKYKETILDLLKQFTPDQIVIERMPSFTPWNPMAGKIATWCNEAIREYLNPFAAEGYFTTGPGEWKPVTGKEVLPFKMKTQHEKDAYRLGRYFLYKFGYVKRPTE